ncbi:prephenate dehydrogenase (NADP(+)) [Orbilia oligospora]|uniref:Prephenate dehydrogenase (NADP(+)) n=1 Tax=Orbilia oligospora TaxID=2813651 RepID=A0A7C8N4B7_ORBOL|nr:prephenate dehydrogenase (NADP(+)) [Orbilia oligospora]KAF3133254.1 prephenate dehydrogenase (NADP(+)) [Orbilia oligospora]
MVVALTQVYMCIEVGELQPDNTKPEFPRFANSDVSLDTSTSSRLSTLKSKFKMSTEIPIAPPANPQDATVGIIGMGDMGRLYAKTISGAGWKVTACDRPDKYEALKDEFQG